MTLKFGTDGVRGVALTELTPDYVAFLGRAAAHVLGGGTWAVGRDPRESGEVLADALARGLRAGGATVELTGVVPTPAMAVLGAERSIPTAMITASHNPYTDNGVKLFAAGGLKLRDDAEARIEAEMERLLDGGVPAEHDDTPAVAIDVAADYVDWVIGQFPAGCLAGLMVVLDCANGAMSEVAPIAAARLGAEVQVINAAPSGRNINDRCGATDTAELAAAVIDRGADLGLAFDGDGDRVIAIDHRGNRVDGDRLIALSALQLKDHGLLDGDAVVVTVMSNLGFHRAMAAAGIEVVTTAVGDRYVLEALEERGLAVGGEQSGHIIFRKLATTGDGLLAGLRLAQFVADHHRPLAEVAAEVMTTYPQVLINVRVADRHPNVADELADEIAAAEAELGDEGRVLIRASGTEPLIRVMVEADAAAIAERVANELADVVRRRFG
ncbi:MAG TPA: phosphoglucosamine mutase [Ilumatobacteraceae bacterium]|nr:phosphoglucosamine mutase [Ilumatobacteraceae bacterium]